MEASQFRGLIKLLLDGQPYARTPVGITPERQLRAITEGILKPEEVDALLAYHATGVIDLKTMTVRDMLVTLGDGYHSLPELYATRHALCAAMTAAGVPGGKAERHADGTRFQDYFLLWFDLPTGRVSFHLPMRHWHHCGVPTYDHGPSWDGHTTLDCIERLLHYGALHPLHVPNGAEHVVESDPLIEYVYEPTAKNWVALTASTLAEWHIPEIKAAFEDSEGAGFAEVKRGLALRELAAYASADNAYADDKALPIMRTVKAALEAKEQYPQTLRYQKVFAKLEAAR